MLISQPSSPGAMEGHEGWPPGDDPGTRLRLAVGVDIDIGADIGVNADIEIGVDLYDVDCSGPAAVGPEQDVLAQMMFRQKQARFQGLGFKRRTPVLILWLSFSIRTYFGVSFFYHLGEAWFFYFDLIQLFITRYMEPEGLWQRPCRYRRLLQVYPFPTPGRYECHTGGIPASPSPHVH